MTYTPNTADQTAHLNELVITFRTLAAKNEAPTIREVVDLLDLDQDNRIVRNACVELKIATKSEFDRELNRARQRAVLGVAPSNATELVKAFADTYSLVARMDGMLTREVKPTFRHPITGVETPITKADRDATPLIDLYAIFHCDAQSRLNRTDFERQLRVLSTNYRMGIMAADITDAVDEWMKTAFRERLHDIFLSVESREPSFDGQREWERFADAVFDCDDTSPAFAAAVMRKFIWQVKRKIRGLPVTDHLMPVLLGPQGIGKSTLVNRLLGPVEELKLNVDFKMVTDDRNVEMWSSYVMFLDEMGYASKADIDSVKNIITAATLTRRPMRSNSKVTIDQSATFIGCSNREIAQLVRDPTGIRRFVGLRMRSDADRDLINAIDWFAMWGAVRVDEADPMADHRKVLAEQQEGSRERSRVEQWMVDFTGANNAYQAGINKAGNINARDLYLAFREFEEEQFPGNYKTAKTDWDHEMARLQKNAPDAMIFDKKRGVNGMMYRWINERHLRAVE